jgi:uncharacterized protein YggT (Ycf19 family)
MASQVKKKQQPSDATLVSIKIFRGISYAVYAYALVASVFLGIGFVLLLFSANANVPFVEFVYKVAAEFLQPFRGIFPLHQVSETGYFSTSALFAIMMYLVFAAALQSLISYLTVKMVKHEQELAELQS